MFIAIVRAMHSADESRFRLDKQHEMLKKLYSRLLPLGYCPKDNDEILDAGTGTGVLTSV